MQLKDKAAIMTGSFGMTGQTESGTNFCLMGQEVSPLAVAKSHVRYINGAILRERGGSMEEFVAHENIKRFEAQLAACTDEQQRRMLLRLLDTERKLLTRIQRSKCSASLDAPKAAPKAR